MSELRVAAAFPDPPFNGTAAAPAGLDIDLIAAIGSHLNRTVRFVPYTGSDFNGIFAALGHAADVVISGTTITSERAAVADFCDPYLVSGQGLATDPARHPGVHGTDDLAGLTIGVQVGNTSEPVAAALVAAGRAAAVRRYPYDAIRSAIADLSSGGCDVVMKLAPVLGALVDGTPARLVARGITREPIAIAVASGDPLRSAIDEVQRELESSGELDRLRTKWLGGPALDQSGVPA